MPIAEMSGGTKHQGGVKVFEVECPCGSVFDVEEQGTWACNNCGRVLDDRGVVVDGPDEEANESSAGATNGGQKYLCDQCGSEIEVLYWRTESFYQDVNPETGVLGKEEKNEYHDFTITDMYCKKDPRHIVDQDIQDKIIEENL